MNPAAQANDGQVPIESAMARLVETVRAYQRVAVALSGGVDSTVVAKAATLALGDAALAITARSPSVPHSEIELAKAVARHIGIRHDIVETEEFADPRYVKNDGTRCYYCKSELYDKVESLRARLNFDVILSGANVDDAGDYRPGLRAAAERHIRHPLQEAGFTKEMVRAAAARWVLANADKPASPCLSSRIAIGLEATPERTQRIEKAEEYLRSLGFGDLRVRYHAGDLARVEVMPAEIGRFLDESLRNKVSKRLLELGFKFVSLDLSGVQSGGLNVLIDPDVLKMQGAG